MTSHRPPTSRPPVIPLSIRRFWELGALALTVFCALITQASAAPLNVSVDEREGLPLLSIGGTSAVSSSYAFWSRDWKWAGQRTEFKVIGPFQYEATSKNRSLNFDLVARISRPSSRQLRWEFDLNAFQATSNIIGGGIIFKLDLAALALRLGEPTLLPGNRGWSWGHSDGDRIELRFDPPAAAVNFEREQKSEVRVFLVKGEVPQGARRITATLEVSGDAAIIPSLAERFGLADPAKWPTDIVGWDVSPVDLSFLNAPEKPAGKRGMLKAKGDKLVFADGTTGRFWGTNLTANTLFGTTRDNVKQQARRLSELGFNLVRLHHHDSYWVNPNIFGGKDTPDTQRLAPDMLDKLDWWIKCLKDEGIYVWLDLHVQRAFKASDGIDGFDEIAKGNQQAELKGYNYVNTSIREAMKRFNENYVNHRNAYTGNRYKDEPAIVAMLITNENDLTNHYGNALLPDKKVPRHNAIYMKAAEAFAAAAGTPKDRTWRSWEHGPSKLFLNDLERRFNAEMIAHLRQQGVRVPLVTTSTWGFNPLSALPALTAGDIIDVHSYGGVGELEKNPIHAANMVHWIAAAQVANRPLSVTEWNVEQFPAPDRHVVPLYVAASARLQGWDALMQYAYAQSPLDSAGRPSNWHAFNDPSLLAALPAAALLFRRGDVREASSIYAFAPSPDQLFNQSISARNSVALRTAAERGKLVTLLPRVRELPWLENSVAPAGATVFTDPQQSFLPRDAPSVVSDTGELRRDWQRGTYVIDTPLTQAAIGWLGAGQVRTTDVDYLVSTRNATVAVQSLDGAPIGKSRHLLISLGARSLPASENQLPYYAEPVEGQLRIRAPKGLRLYIPNRSESPGSSHKRSLGKSQEAAREIPVRHENGRYRIDLSRDFRSYWLVLK